MTAFILHILLPTGAAGSVFYLLVLLLRPALPNMGGQGRRLLVLAATAMLLVPLPFIAQKATTLFANGAQAAPSPLHSLPITAPAFTAGEFLHNALAAPTLASQNTMLATTPLQAYNPASLLPLLYLGGLGFTLTFSIGRYVWFLRKIHRQSSLVTSGDAYQLLHQHAAQLGLRRTPALYSSPAVCSPLLTGMFRPRILLPESSFSPEETSFALQHELTHLQHGDIPLKLLVYLVTALHWFNPLGLLLRRDMNAACEMHCDQSIARGLDGAGKKQYASALLAYTAAPLPYMVSGFALPIKKMKSRLQKLLVPVRLSRRASAAALAATGCLLAVGLLAGCSMAAGAAGVASLDPQGSSSIPEQGSSSPAALGGASSSTPPEAPSTTAPSKADASTPPSTSQSGVVIVDESSSPYPPIVKNIETLYLEDGTPIVFILPVSGDVELSRTMGNSTHRGIDLNAEVDTPIVAAAAGRVIRSEYHWSYGNMIELDHGSNITTLYAHCNSLNVEVGETVQAGQQIATIGNSGNSSDYHVHIELSIDGELANFLEYCPDILLSSTAKTE